MCWAEGSRIPLRSVIGFGADAHRALEISRPRQVAREVDRTSDRKRMIRAQALDEQVDRPLVQLTRTLGIATHSHRDRGIRVRRQRHWMLVREDMSIPAPGRLPDGVRLIEPATVSKVCRICDGACQSARMRRPVHLLQPCVCGTRKVQRCRVIPCPATGHSQVRPSQQRTGRGVTDQAPDQLGDFLMPFEHLTVLAELAAIHVRATEGVERVRAIESEDGGPRTPSRSVQIESCSDIATQSANHRQIVRSLQPDRVFGCEKPGRVVVNRNVQVPRAPEIAARP